MERTNEMQPSALRSPATQTSSAPRILLDDDDELVRVAIHRVLTAAGFDVTAVRSPAEALSRLTVGHGFDAVVTDLVMPGGTGVELLRCIRGQGNEELPVIIFTGRPSLESARSSIGDGRVRYVLKSAVHDELLSVLRELVDESSAAAPRSSLRPSSPNDIIEEHRHFDSALQNVWIAFQPIVDLRERTVFGYEALVRSRQPGLERPALLFAAAGRLERTRELGRRIRELVARRVASAPSEARIFVNLHAAELDDPELHAATAPLSAYAGRVVLEVTERGSLGGVEDLKGRLRSLRDLGFSIALHDVGSGYAGLASFTLLDPEIVKLDASLVRGIDAQPRLQRLVGSLLQACAEDMEMIVVCEGVETPDERDTLLALGAHLQQGYLYGRPAYDFERPRP